MHRTDHSLRSPIYLRTKFPELDFDYLPDVWWHNGQKNPNGVPKEPEDLFHARIARRLCGSSPILTGLMVQFPCSIRGLLMTQFIEGLDWLQTMLLPECLDD